MSKSIGNHCGYESRKILQVKKSEATTQFYSFLIISNLAVACLTIEHNPMKS